MRKNKWKRMFQDELQRDAKRILDEVNSDESLRDVEAPDIIYSRIQSQLHPDANLTPEQKELIEIGRYYKYRKKKNFRPLVVAAAAILILAFGLTATGAGERVIEKVEWWIAGRLQQNLDSGSNPNGPEVVSEDEAYELIEKTFGVYPVKRTYLPKGMDFTKAVIEEELQNARIYYDKGNEKMICFSIWFQYRNSSTGIDVEDVASQKTTMDVSGHTISLYKYDMENGQMRYRIELEHQKVYYFIITIGLTDTEVENFVKNLNFF